MKNLHTFRLWANTWVRPYVFCLSLFILHSSFFTLCKAQNVAINATGNQADPSAMLDVSSQSAGVLIPRMGTSARNAISSPATGLQIYNTDCNELNYWNGTCWLSFGTLPAPGLITSNQSTALCAAVTATYSITAITGATGYVWYVPAGATVNSGEGTTSISVTFGNYSGQICVTAYDACESSEQRCIDINVSPIPPTPGNITGLASVNPGQNLVTYFIASVSGAGVYNWSVPSGAAITAGVGTPAITVNFSCSAVSGNVSVTAGSNCGTSSPSSLFVTVTPLSINAGSAVFGGIAIGGSPTASGGQTPYTYSWSPNSNLSSATVANPTALCSGSTTTYTVNVTDYNGCSASSSVIVTRNLTANAGSGIFGGSALTGTATGGVSPYAYSWSPNSNLSGYTVSNPTALCSGSTTNYTLTVTDANGCTATSGVAVTRNLTASAGSNAITCSGTTIGGSPTASGGINNSYIYSWNPSTGLSNATIANPTASPLSTTSYSVTVTDANGCTATSSMALTISGTHGLQTFNYTGSQQTFIVPNCDISVTITVYGAQGTNNGAAGGYGGSAQGILSVTSGQTLYVYVGGQGGYNGGGPPGSGGSWPGVYGGGASDVRVGGTGLSNRIIVAGGGGGGGSSGSSWSAYAGGAGGGSSGGGGGGCCGSPMAGGASGSSGGGAGYDCGGCGYGGTVGTLGQGGTGSLACSSYGTGSGGGGGYYGGGGGATCGSGGSGGGGDGYIGGVTNGSMGTGVQTGNGQIIISY